MHVNTNICYILFNILFMKQMMESSFSVSVKMILRRVAIVLFMLIGYSGMVLADNNQGIIFKFKHYTYRVLQDNEVELIDIPSKFKEMEVSNCRVELPSTVKYKGKEYELVSIADNVFCGIFKGNQIGVFIPPTIREIGPNNKIHKVYYTSHQWSSNSMMLLDKDLEYIVWVNKKKTGRVDKIYLPETLKSLPIWLWEYYPKLQYVIFPKQMDEVSILNLFEECDYTPYLSNNILFLVKSNRTGEIIWESPMCKELTILDYPSILDVAHLDFMREHFTNLELCSVEGCEYPCVYMDNALYNPMDGNPVFELPFTKGVNADDTLSLSVNQFANITQNFIDFHAPKHIEIINNTKGPVKFNRNVLKHISQLAKSLDVTVSLPHINQCHVEGVNTPFKVYDGNLYNPTTGELFVLTLQDTIKVKITDENKLAMIHYIEQLGTERAVQHVKYVVEDIESLSPIETQDMAKICAAGISVSPVSSVPKSISPTSSIPEYFPVPDVLPEFPGGMSEMMKFIRENLRYPTICQDQGIQGRVVVQFIVDENGNIINPQVKDSINPYLDKEAMRVVSIMPRWKPGMLDGKPIPTRFTAPFTFRLSN